MPFFPKKQFSKSFLKEKTTTQLTSEQHEFELGRSTYMWNFFNKYCICTVNVGLPCCSLGKESTSNALDTGDIGSIPGTGRSPGEGNGNLLQYSCQESSMDRGACGATVCGVAKESDTT